VTVFVVEIPETGRKEPVTIASKRSRYVVIHSDMKSHVVDGEKQ
jgi:hypothetical protein